MPQCVLELFHYSCLYKYLYPNHKYFLVFFIGNLFRKTGFVRVFFLFIILDTLPPTKNHTKHAANLPPRPPPIKSYFEYIIIVCIKKKYIIIANSQHQTMVIIIHITFYPYININIIKNSLFLKTIRHNCATVHIFFCFHCFRAIREENNNRSTNNAKMLSGKEEKQ